MEPENEYDDNRVKLPEPIRGPGYMTPGGAGNIAKILHDLEPAV